MTLTVLQETADNQSPCALTAIGNSMGKMVRIPHTSFKVSLGVYTSLKGMCHDVRNWKLLYLEHSKLKPQNVRLTNGMYVRAYT